MTNTDALNVRASLTQMIIIAVFVAPTSFANRTGI